MGKLFYKKKTAFFFSSKHPYLLLILFFSTFVFCTMGNAYGQQQPFITMQSTSSTVNSGLYDYILPLFKKNSGIRVYVVSSGTGTAIRNAMNGDGDLLLVHSRKAEELFVKQGFGIKRHDVMYNDFIIIGPSDDPANIHEATDLSQAFRNIAKHQSIFLSRGDDSGTHRKELSLWEKSGINPLPHSGTWYREAGAGMGITLNIAIGMRAYTIADRGTWLRFRNKFDFVIHIENQPELFNPYGIIAINPRKHPHVKSQQAQKFIDWITGTQGQQAIADYKIFGKQLFFPNALEDK